MQVRPQERTFYAFSSVSQGTVFLLDGEYYMKTSKHRMKAHFTAVRLRDGLLCDVDPDAHVTEFPDAEMLPGREACGPFKATFKAVRLIAKDVDPDAQTEAPCTICGDPDDHTHEICERGACINVIRVSKDVEKQRAEEICETCFKATTPDE